MNYGVRGEYHTFAKFEHLGSLREVIAPGEPDDNDQIWTGNISVIKRLQTGEVRQADIDEQLSEQNLNRYYAVASLEAPTRCIDGRCKHGYHPHTGGGRSLGPQVPGGTATAALCRRIADTAPLEDDRDVTTVNDRITAETFTADIDDMHNLMQFIHWKVGAHTGDHAAKGDTGCGAIDKLPEILERITSPRAQSQLRGLVRRLLGEDYRKQIVNELMSRFFQLQGKAAAYFARDADGNYAYKRQAIEQFRRYGGVENLSGQHNEVALVINLVEGTTFDRDQFAADNNHRIQIFNYDFWRSLQLAEFIPRFKYQENEEPMSVQQHIDLRNRFITARALFAAATAMVLTDGSLELIVRDNK